MPAKLAETVGEVQSGVGAVDHEHGKAVAERSRGIGDCEQQDVVAGLRVRNELLAPGDLPASVDTDRPGPYATEVGSRLRLGERDAGRLLCPQRRLEQPVSLLLIAVRE